VVRGLMVFFDKTCSLLLGVLEQPRVYNSNAGSLKHRPQLGTISPIGLKPVLCLREENLSFNALAFLFKKPMRDA
jgi:hypothetical protein